MNRPPNPETYPRLRIWWENYHPKLNWPGLILLVLLVLLLIVTGLPFLLPLDGPQSVDPETLADPNGAFVTVHGERLYYVHAPGSGETILLVHGFGGSSVSWAETIPALAQAGYNVYALDLRGFGLSDKGWNASYTRSAQAARVVAFMYAMQIDQAVLIGHSMGGGVVVQVALTHPERVSRLVLVDATVLDRKTTFPDFLLNLPFARRWGRIIIRRAVTASVGRDMLLDAATNDTAITPQLVDDYSRTLHTPGWDLALMAMVRDMGNDKPLPAGNLRVPTLIIWGDHDTWVLPSEGEELERLIPGAQRVVLPNVGHLPMHEAPEAFQVALLRFLRGE